MKRTPTIVILVALFIAPGTVAIAANEPVECVAPAMQIPNFTHAVAIEMPAPKYPQGPLNEWSEGWVLLQYGVTATGEPFGIAAIDAFGPKDFVGQAISGITKWRFKPATRNGVAVEQYLARTEVTFQLHDSGRSADHGDFIAKYKKAERQLRERDFDGAIDTLKRAFQGNLNLYEAARGSLLWAIAAANKDDWETAAYYINHATIESGNYLEKSLHKHAYALQTEAMVRTGAFQSAKCALERVRTVAPEMASSDSPLGKTIAALEAAVNDRKPIALAVRLIKHPVIDAPAIWRHSMLRSKFRFANVTGDVGTFRLNCTGTKHEAAVDEETLWDVPSKAGVCVLQVVGQPGAGFTLVEAWEAPP